MIASCLQEVALCFDNMKYGHNETMKSRVKGMRASVVPMGRTYFWADFPGTVCLAANFRCRIATLQNQDRDLGASGRSWVERWVDLGKGGQKMGKWTGFARLESALTRLGPDNLTQVVDFPHLAMVSIFCEGVRNNHRDTEAQSRAVMGNKMGRLN